MSFLLPLCLLIELGPYGGPSGEVFREFICIAPEIYLVRGNIVTSPIYYVGGPLKF